MSTNVEHRPVVNEHDDTGWTTTGGMSYSPGCSCGVIPGTSYPTREIAAGRMVDLPSKCRRGQRKNATR